MFLLCKEMENKNIVFDYDVIRREYPCDIQSKMVINHSRLCHVTCSASISDVGVTNVGLYGCTGFIGRVVATMALKSKCFSAKRILVSKPKSTEL